MSFIHSSLAKIMDEMSVLFGGNVSISFALLTVRVTCYVILIVSVIKHFVIISGTV